MICTPTVLYCFTSWRYYRATAILKATLWMFGVAHIVNLADAISAYRTLYIEALIILAVVLDGVGVILLSKAYNTTCQRR